MSDIIIEGLSTVLSLAIGGLIGYVVAYVTGLKAIRKGMQLMLRGALDDMYVKFHHEPPTTDELRRFEEMYVCYEHLAENGVMQAKHDEVLKMHPKDEKCLNE